MEIAGRIALVTGGGHRVGRALCLALARAGADVVVDYNRSRAKAEETVAEIRALGRRAVAVQADVTRENALDTLLESARGLGGLDILVNSASVFRSAPLNEITRAEWDRVLAINLTAPFHLSRVAAPLLAEGDGGVIVNIADLSAFQPWPSYAHHSVSKAGLVHLTRVLALALAPAVRVNCIAPGTVLPPETYSAGELERDRARTALGRIGAPADVARALLFLVESDFITGEVVVVDGGRLLRNA